MHSVTLARRLEREDLLIARLVELARRKSRPAARLRNLCELDLPEFNRHVLSRVMCELGTNEDLYANLKLIDDAKPSPIPQGVWDQLKGAFVVQQPHRLYQNVFTQHARASNELRAQLFGMVFGDRKRRRSALKILGEIEAWRLEQGRPTDEPRHPDLVSGHPWPPNDVDFLP